MKLKDKCALITGAASGIGKDIEKGRVGFAELEKYAIKLGEVKRHREWVLRNYALIFGAVTLRIWLPILIIAYQGEFLPAYRWVAWLAWVPNLLWVERLRTSVPFLFFISFAVSTGMWLERYVIIVTSLHRDFLPSSWGMYAGTRWDWAAFVGTLGLFLTLLFLFVRFLPAISIFEMRTILPGAAMPEEKR